MPVTQDEKNAKQLRDCIAKIPENKRCADCTAKGPVYANTTFNTFVCTACSGIHREFNHRVKSISMASFKPDEMKGLLEGGNAVAREKWMSRWSPSDFPEPDPGDPERLRQFIRLKYLDRKWVAGGNNSSSGSTTASKKAAPRGREAEIPKAEPLSNFLGSDLPPMHVSTQKASSGSFAASFPQQQSQQPQQQGGWASFDNVNWATSSPPSQIQQQPKPQQPQAQPSLFDAPLTAPSSGLEGLLFPSQEEVQRIEQEKQAKLQEESAKKRQNDLMSQLGSMYQQQAQANQQQMLLQQQQLMMQMAQQAQQGMNPQQQQLYMQQMQQMMRQFPQMGQVAPQVPAQVSPFGAPLVGQPIPSQISPFGATIPSGGFGVQAGGLGTSTSPTGFGGLAASPFVEATKPAEPVQPAKPDPFAALSPFSLGASAKSSTPSKQPTNTTPQNNDPFGFGGSVPPTSQNNTDFFGSGSAQSNNINPFGALQAPPSQQTSQQDFNPFF